METWQISRAGVINFWYYDEEIFNFEEGRLLLRGSNGSGKSVTMQSLVPLLFDGNKSPERLDPFGSKARKMESYLLSDGLDLDERTGYLFLEFEKAASRRYVTIGMGMRARKNMPLQTWYFIVKDNRRIGKDLDFTLYRDLGDKIPFTQKELENKIGEGGVVYSKQKDYKAAVNELLFGYSDMTDFDELIELLIQIRSPKLSKEFKPTTMYEIMQNSLVTLTDEDLRPMSEAIENMDEIKLKIDALERSKKSLIKIQSAYEKYNLFMLSIKSDRLMRHSSEEEKWKRAIEANQKAVHEAKEALESLASALLDLSEEEAQLKNKEASLQNHNLSGLAHEGEGLRQNILGFEKSISEKNAQLALQKDLFVKIQSEIKLKTDDFEAAESALMASFETLDSDSEVAGFDEHSFFLDEYKKAQGPVDFSFHKGQLEAHQKRLKEGLKALSLQVEWVQKYDDSLELLDAIASKLADENRFLLECEKQLNQVKAEFAEKTFAWHGKNKVLLLPQKVLQEVTERIYSYNEPYRFDQALEPLRQGAEGIKGAFFVELHKKNGEKSSHLDRIQALKNEYDALNQKADPEPLRSDATVKNRERLAALGIPFVPLYKALDFGPDLTDGQKGIVEEAMEAMGLLDALVVHPDAKQKVMAMATGEADRYIFSTPEFLSHNLTTLLKVEEKSHAFGKPFVEDILMSVFVHESEQRFYITEDGFYGMGLIKGKVSGEVPSRFIGHMARQRYKAEMLKSIEGAIDLEKVALEGVEAAIQALTDQMALLEKEWQLFPDNSDLEVAYTQWLNASNQVALLQKEEARYRDTSEHIYRQLNEVKNQVVQKTKGLYLTLSLEVFEEAVDAIDSYSQGFSRWIQLDQRMNYVRSHLKTLEDQMATCLETEDALRYDLSMAERALSRARVRLEDIESQLKMSDFEAIREDLAQCKARLSEIPGVFKRLVKEQSDLESALRQMGAEEATIEENLLVVREKRVLYEKAFLSELSLGHVMPIEAADGVPAVTKAKAVLGQWGQILQEQKTILHYWDALKEKFLSESTELAEYHMRFNYLFRDLCEGCTSDDITHIERVDITAKVQGKTMDFKALSDWIELQIMDSVSLLNEQDRALFEEILINAVSRKIGAKIYHSEAWVRKIDELMNSMDTSSGLSFHLKWVTKEAQSEDQLSTKDLVALLRGDQALLTREEKDKLIKHFQSKIGESKRKLEDTADNRSFLTIMKDVLDYRKWFEFQLFFTKKGDRRKELTNNAFYTFSGGEKAMAMYVPLFSAVFAKYMGANVDCPKVVSLDEAFAGVDEKNIIDMFRLLVKELNLGFIANSQVLYGDYETVPSLAIYELIRPENATFVTTIRYKWNGRVRELINGDD